MKKFFTGFGKSKNENNEQPEPVLSENEQETDITENNDYLSEDTPDFSGPAEDAKPKRIKKYWSNKKKIIVFSILGVLLLAIIGIGIYVYTIYTNPMGTFENLAQQMSAAPSIQSVDPSDANPSESASVDPYDALKKQADNSMLTDIVNVMLVGVDHSEERNTWNGKKAFHADVMIVLAINTKTNKVDMISLPRDTYAKIPGYENDIYKLNAAIDVGGGWPTEGGFNKVCEAASWMISGIPVKYYYAVDMNAVKGLVDVIGGVDYDLDLDFDLMGRSYKAGQQHMNGQAVLDYLRVRKDLGSESGDLNRIDRQKKMLISIFNKIKQTDLLPQIPNLLQAFDGELHMNTSFAQTAALALFMKNVDSANIKMHSMDGTYDNFFDEWRFVYTNQKNRVAIIKEVYGIDAKQETYYSHSAAKARWEARRKPTIIRKSNDVLAKAKKILKADAKLPIYEPPSASPSPEASDGKKSENTSKKTVGAKIPKGYRQYPEGGAVWKLYETTSSLCSSYDAGKANTEKAEQLMSSVEKLCDKLGISKPSWKVGFEKNNKVDVDFR